MKALYTALIVILLNFAGGACLLRTTFTLTPAPIQQGEYYHHPKKPRVYIVDKRDYYQYLFAVVEVPRLRMICIASENGDLKCKN